MPYSPYVEAFTSGKISRFAPVYLIFSEEITPERMQNTEVNKPFKIKPDIKGGFSFENNKTIAFKPFEPMPRNTEYMVTVDMSGWFDATGDTKYFVFKYSTLPLALRVVRQSIDINAENETGYDISYKSNTPDKEIAETVEGLIKFSKKVDIEWVSCLKLYKIWSGWETNSNFLSKKHLSKVGAKKGYFYIISAATRQFKQV